MKKPELTILNDGGRPTLMLDSKPVDPATLGISKDMMDKIYGAYCTKGTADEINGFFAVFSGQGYGVWQQ
jgi:hypothetical protein